VCVYETGLCGEGPMAHFCCFRWASSSGLARRRAFPRWLHDINAVPRGSLSFSLFVVASAACVYETGLLLVRLLWIGLDLR